MGRHARCEEPSPPHRRPGLDPGPRLFVFKAMGQGNRGGWVYIMADRYRGTLYVGITAHLPERIQQHRDGTGSGFCAKYGLTRLVWAEHGDDIHACIAHEKRLKRWRREWKFDLIERANPEWNDLFDALL